MHFLLLYHQPTPTTPHDIGDSTLHTDWCPPGTMHLRRGVGAREVLRARACPWNRMLEVQGNGCELVRGEAGNSRMHTRGGSSPDHKENSTTELDDAGTNLGGGATQASTISKRASVATRNGQGVRPILIVPWWLHCMCTTRTSREIRSRSTSLSSGKDSTAISMARWVDASISDGSGGQVEKEGRNISRSPLLG
jgi:hypothetical protein